MGKDTAGDGATFEESVSGDSDGLRLWQSLVSSISLSIGHLRSAMRSRLKITDHFAFEVRTEMVFEFICICHGVTDRGASSSTALNDLIHRFSIVFHVSQRAGRENLTSLLVSEPHAIFSAPWCCAKAEGQCPSSAGRLAECPVSCCS